MDERLYIREKTKQHYNQHVEEGVSTADALKARREGPAAPLKLFHNEIKRRLIYRFAYGAESLLDYACGRGGDIHKWKSAKVQRVKGLDLSPNEIDEARRRYDELVNKNRGHLALRCEFEQTDLLGLQVVKEEQPFDVITCMFALHYFFDKEDTCKVMLQTIAANLKTGGYFIACLPDGKRVKGNLQRAGGILEEEHLYLKQLWQGKDSPFGSKYIMNIPDTVVEGHEGFSEGSEEFLVFEKVLLGLAGANGLCPVVDLADPELSLLFDPSDADKPVKHFNPQYPDGTHSSLTLASKLYMAVVLQKTGSAAAAAAAPALPPVDTSRGGGRQQQHKQQQQQHKQGSGRSRRSPTQAERYGEASYTQVGNDHIEQQQQHQGTFERQEPQQPRQHWHGGGGRGRGRGHDWQLPYAAMVLPPNEMPSAYLNNKSSELVERQSKGRFIIQLPLLPYAAGPVQYDQLGNPIFQQLPNGHMIYSYYDELEYHSQLQQQQQPLPLQPPVVGSAAAGSAAVQNQQQQQQQQQHQPVLQSNAVAGSSNFKAQQPLQQQQQRSGWPPPSATDANSAAHQEQRQQQSQSQQPPSATAAPAPAAAAAAAGDALSNTAGGGRGRGRGRGAGAKRSRDALDSAAGAGNGAAAASAAAIDAGSGGGANLEGQPAAKKAASARIGSRTTGAHRPPAPDPLGYKQQELKDVPALTPELVERLLKLAPSYLEG